MGLVAIQRLIEEERDWHLQDTRDLLKAAGADAVLAALIFLNLLKRKIERIAELLLNSCSASSAACGRDCRHTRQSESGLFFPGGRFTNTAPSDWLISCGDHQNSNGHARFISEIGFGLMPRVQ